MEEEQTAVAPEREDATALIDDIEAYMAACRKGDWKAINATLNVVQKALHRYYETHGWPRLSKDNPTLTIGR